MQFLKKSMLLLTFMGLVNNCVGIPPAPKVDIGVLRVQEITPEKFKLEALFINQNGTAYKINAAKLDKYLVIHPQQALDMISWMNKIMVVLKAELYKQ